MRIETLNVWGACSTLLIRNLDKSAYNGSKGFSSDLKSHLDKQKCHEFSFLMASTNQVQKKIQNWLRGLGFQETPEIFNSKNGSKVILFFIPIPQIFENLGLKHPLNEKEK